MEIAALFSGARRADFSFAARVRAASLRALMKLTSIFAVCALAFFLNACEQHPVPGEAPVKDYSEPAKAEAAAEHAKPAEPAKAGEKPQFFPDKAEKK